MEPTIKCGKHFVNHCKMTGSRFEDVCLGDAEFDNVSLANARFNNVNMSDIKVTYIQWGGALFKNIGLPSTREYQGKTQRPLNFESCDINGSTLTNCNLRNVKIHGCDIEGMTINGILIQDLLSAHNRKTS